MLILQKFGFKDSAYARPQDKWVCGRLVDGHPCSLGPTADGCCQVNSVCRPALEDGRWQCRRGPNDGGPCDAGPLPDGQCCQKPEPCVPTPSLRTRRKRLALWATTFVVGLMALALGSQQASQFLMPGPLSSPHASQTQCKSCHLNMETDNLKWLHSFAAKMDPLENAKLCIECHKVGDDPFSPHTHPVEQLRQLTAHYGNDGHEIKNESLLHQITLPVPQRSAMTGSSSETSGSSDDTTIFCATCHQEHQGTFHDQTQMSDMRCQTCHTSKFGAFATSHPEFTDYPFNRRTRIIFNHKSHFGTHFPKSLESADPSKTPPEVCADCHRPGVGQRYMEIRGYQPMCANCHSGDILGTTRATGPKGIDFLAVPGLDVLTLSERAVDIGVWPEDSEADLTPFMRALIAAEPGGADLIEAIEPLDLLDLTDAEDSDLANVKILAWKTKALFQRLQSQQLSDAVMTLPANQDGHEIDRVQMARLTGIMSHDVIRSANREWFPDLADDLNRRENDEPTKSFTASRPRDEEEASSAESALQDANSGVDAGTEDLGDDLEEASDDLEQSDSAGTDSILEGDDDLETLDDTVAGDDLNAAEDDLAGADDLEAVEGLDDEGPGLLDDGSGDADPDAELGGSDDILESASDTASADDDILGGDDAADGEESFEADAALPAGEGDDLELVASDDGDGLTEGGQEQDATQTPDVVSKPFDPEYWAEFGGWYRQDFSIRYRPSGHSDRFLRTWLDYSGHAFGSDQQALLAPIFDTLAGKDALGRCAKCHSIDNEEGYKHIKWRAFSTRRVKNRFTTFSHEPHISASGNKGCVFCHELNPSKADYLKTYESGAANIFAPNFKPIEKTTCSDCHTAQTAGEGCTLCHNYHAAEFSRPLVKTKLP